MLARHPETVTLKQLAQDAGLHPSTAHRILAALVNDRLVERVDQGNYRLGIRLLELGNLVKSRISVREHALPFMRQLHEATGEAVNLSVRREDEIVYVERTSSGRAMMRVVNIVGARAPLHITAVGKLFQSNTNRRTKRNLLVFLRPTVLRTKDDAGEASQRKYDAIWDVEIRSNNGEPAPDMNTIYDGRPK